MIFLEVTDAEFRPGEQWVSISGNSKVTILTVEKYSAADSDYCSNYRIVYDTEEGIRENDGWNFQVSYCHISEK